MWKEGKEVFYLGPEGAKWSWQSAAKNFGIPWLKTQGGAKNNSGGAKNFRVSSVTAPDTISMYVPFSMCVPLFNKFTF